MNPLWFLPPGKEKPSQLNDILTALQAKEHIYAGTVPPRMVAQRRAKNKRARAARKLQRHH